MSRIVLDTSGWPLVVSDFPPAFDEADLNDYFARITSEVHARRRPFVNVNDLSVAGIPGLALQRPIARFMAEQAEYSALFCLAAVQVVPSSLVRGALSAIFWLQRPRWTTFSVATRAEAIAWSAPYVERAREG